MSSSGSLLLIQWKVQEGFIMAQQNVMLRRILHLSADDGV